MEDGRKNRRGRKGGGRTIKEEGRERKKKEGVVRIILTERDGEK